MLSMKISEFADLRCLSAHLGVILRETSFVVYFCVVLNDSFPRPDDNINFSFKYIVEYVR